MSWEGLHGVPRINRWRSQRGSSVVACPNENGDPCSLMRRVICAGPSLEDAGHWVDVYLEMLALFQRILASAAADQKQLLTAEVERIGGRIDYWRGFAQS
jgi:hypothetical protein